MSIRIEIRVRRVRRRHYRFRTSDATLTDNRCAKGRELIRVPTPKEEVAGRTKQSCRANAYADHFVGSNVALLMSRSAKGNRENDQAG